MQNWLLIRTLVAAASSFLLFLPLSLGLHGLIATLAQFFSGWHLYRNWKKSPLPPIGITSAYLFSFYLIFAHGAHGIYFETSTCLITLLLFGRLMENRILREVKNQEKLLLSIRPKQAQVKRKSQLLTIPASEIQVGDLFVVEQGKRIPADGILEKGQSIVDESILFGEGSRGEKRVGSPLYAGSMNHHSTLIGRATKAGNNTLLQHLIQLQQNNQSSSTPTERLAQKTATFLLPLVLSIAIFTWLGWSFTQQGFLSALAVLLIASPRTFKLATALPLTLACNKSYAKGILIKDANAIEKGRKIDRIIIDKKALISEEALSVEKTTIPQSYFPIVKTLCEHADSAGAKAILAHLEQQAVPSLTTMMVFRKAPKEGVSGYFDERKYFLGSLNFFEKSNLTTTPFQQPHKEEAGSLIVFGTETLSLGYFLLTDQVELETEEAMLALKELKIETQLLCSDQQRHAEKIAQALHFDRFQPEIEASDQLKFVEMAKREGKTVAMVSEQMQALSEADIGFGKIPLMDVVKTIQRSKITYQTISQNLLFTFCYHLIGIPLAAFGFIHPILATAAMTLTTLLILNNSTRRKGEEAITPVQIKKGLLQLKHERSMD